MATDPGKHARDRAASAGRRAEELRTRREASTGGGERPDGSTPAEVQAATRRARAAVTRLLAAYESSALAHDRAATVHADRARRAGDPDGTHARSAAVHREAAAHDRSEAAKLAAPLP